MSLDVRLPFLILFFLPFLFVISIEPFILDLDSFGETRLPRYANIVMMEHVVEGFEI